MSETVSFSPLEGGCACGALRFRMEAAPIITHACHCRLCQRSSGSALAVNSMIETRFLRVTRGEPVRVAADRDWTALACGDCGADLWSHHPQLGAVIAFVGSGMLDEGDRLAPEAHYFVRSKHPWIVLPQDVPAFETLGDPGKAEAKARIAAALAAVGAGPPP